MSLGSGYATHPQLIKPFELFKIQWASDAHWILNSPNRLIIWGWVAYPESKDIFKILTLTTEAPMNLCWKREPDIRIPLRREESSYICDLVSDKGGLLKSIHELDISSKLTIDQGQKSDLWHKERIQNKKWHQTNLRTTSPFEWWVQIFRDEFESNSNIISERRQHKSKSTKILLSVTFREWKPWTFLKIEPLILKKNTSS